MSKNVMSYAEVIALNDELKVSITKHGDYSKYYDGVSDQTIADKLGITLHNVVGLRKKLYGNLKEPEKKTVEQEQIRARYAASDIGQEPQDSDIRWLIQRVETLTAERDEMIAREEALLRAAYPLIENRPPLSPQAAALAQLRKGTT